MKPPVFDISTMDDTLRHKCNVATATQYQPIKQGHKTAVSACSFNQGVNTFDRCSRPGWRTPGCGAGTDLGEPGLGWPSLRAPPRGRPLADQEVASSSSTFSPPDDCGGGSSADTFCAFSGSNCRQSGDTSHPRSTDASGLLRVEITTG